MSVRLAGLLIWGMCFAVWAQNPEAATNTPPVAPAATPTPKIANGLFAEPDADVAIKSAQSSADTTSAPVVANIVIDWSKPTFVTTRRQFSLNIFGGFTPGEGANPLYRANLAYMNPGLLRFHNYVGMMSDYRKDKYGWMNADTKTWEPERIAETLDAASLPNAEVLITIGRWPDWMDKDKDGQLDEDCYQAFAQLCADLVRIVNIDQKRGVRYFEITNERDFVYWLRQKKEGAPMQVDKLAKIYLLCSEAMKKVDPSIKTGGPAACRGDLIDPLRQFALLTAPELDFLSYHEYATGDAKEPDISIYDKTNWIGKNIGQVRAMLDEVSPNRHIELHLNEYNICYAPELHDKRMTNNEGAVFDALTMIAFAQNGLDAGNAWNELDHNDYGKMDPDGNLHPGAHVYHYFNDWLVGRAVSAESDHHRQVVPLAVDADDHRAFVLVNRSAAANRVHLGFAHGAAPDAPHWQVAQIDGAGLSQSNISSADLAKEIVLPPYSVTFYRAKQTHKPTPVSIINHQTGGQL